ncbi:hypothetical protein [Methylocella sp.]|jgi:hypothetical protein|uniref:hypothetical protein n=1 Tax=Methylocella sp. TaxID=1978226 RepID=UPI003C270D29
MADNLNRRSALAKLGLGLAATSTLAASAIAAPAAISPELLRLIETHKAADDAHMAAADRKFEATRSASGLSAAEVDRISRDRDLAWDAWSDAIAAICAYRCKTIEEANLKFRYIFADDGISHECLWDDHVEALLQSLREVEA